MRYSISIVIPAYNEENRLGRTLEKIHSYCRKKRSDYEVIVVDDGSKDRTVKIAQKFKNTKVLKNKGNKGKGYSVRHGVMNASKDLILFSDADLSTPIEMLDRLLPYADKYDIVIGSRKAKGSDIKVKQPFYRSFAGKLFPLIVNLFLVRDIKDTQCGFKLFKNKVAKKLFSMQRITRFSFDAEILYIAKKKKYSIKEVPVIWENDPNSKVNIIKDSFRMFKDLLRIRFYDLTGNYD